MRLALVLREMRVDRLATLVAAAQREFGAVGMAVPDFEDTTFGEESAQGFRLVIPDVPGIGVDEIGNGGARRRDISI